MRPVLLLFALGCGSGSSPKEEAIQAPPPISTPRIVPPITGAHGGAMSLLAVTADGDAAFTADATGGLRLWPTLDGTREPIVVHGPAPAALAIGRDGQGFAVAITDAADHVVLVRLDHAGSVRSRRALGEAMQIVIAGDHVLALRADRVIDKIALDGALVRQLAPDAGSRVESLLVTGAHVAAMISNEDGHRVRHIDLATLAWGAVSPKLDVDEDAAPMLVPDGSAVLALGTDDQIHRFDLATGKDQPACPASLGRRRDAFGAGRDDAAIGVVGERVACFVNANLSWFTPATAATQTTTFGTALTPDVMIAAGEHVVVASEHQLAIVTPDRTMYLGYGFRDLTHVRSVPTGVMIGKGDQEPVLLDDRFHERARFALPKLRVDWTDLVPVDDRFIIASSTRPGSGDLWGSAYQIAIYDTVKQVMHQVLPNRARGGELVYEPSTRLLVLTDGKRTTLARLDPVTHTLGDEFELAIATPPKQIALLDPTLSAGVIALVIQDEGAAGLEISEFRAADVPPANEADAKRAITAHATYRVTGELRAVDRAGRLYVRNLLHADGVAIYEHGKAGARLPGAHAAQLRASPDAKHVVAIEGSQLALYTTAGVKRWETAAWGSSDVAWTPSGTLFARFPHALARVDLETGQLVERQCGWGFGIATTQRDGGAAAPSVCDVAP